MTSNCDAGFSSTDPPRFDVAGAAPILEIRPAHHAGEGCAGQPRCGVALGFALRKVESLDSDSRSAGRSSETCLATMSGEQCRVVPAGCHLTTQTNFGDVEIQSERR